MPTLAEFDADYDLTPDDPMRSPIANGFYTVRFPDGSHRTFRVHTKMFGDRKRVLSVLIGPENTTDYEGIAWVGSNGFNVWKRQRGSKNEEQAHILWQMAMGCEADGHELLISKRCLFCNRQLTDPESIEVGIGPTCRERYAS